MSTFRIFDRKIGSIVTAVALLVATVVPGIVSAAQVTERSVQLSSSSASATSVTYTANFKSANEADALVLDFCSNSPLYGEDCDTPTGFSVSSATSTTTNFTDENVVDSNTMRITGEIADDTAISLDIAGVTNPSAVGTIYVRIATFDTVAHANAYVSNPVEPAVNTGLVDDGSVAISIRPTVGVSGAVLETMTFCVSAAAPTENCGGVTAPVLALGRDVGDGVIALDTVVSEGTLYTQVSTNASAGAIISLKSTALGCGGLLRAGGTPGNCDIAPALTGGIANGEAKFGVKTGTVSNVGSNHNGTIQPVGVYNNSTFALNFDDDDETGVTSTYGDPILDTNDEPVNNKNMNLTFGAAISNSTPAGRYSTDLSLIATGKF